MKAVILTGDGINCEIETARAFREAGAETKIIHVNELLSKNVQETNSSHELLKNTHILAFPGGFSFGDELRSGKILAEKLRHQLLTEITALVNRGGLVIGICNGFQVLMQLGVFESSETEERTLTLATNDHGQFLDQWVDLKVSSGATDSPWFMGINGTLSMPMRHKEGRIVLSKDSKSAPRVALQYTQDVNGAYQNAAAILDSSGRILGIMPHPEAATEAFLNPSTSLNPEENAKTIRKIFTNAVQALKENRS